MENPEDKSRRIVYEPQWDIELAAICADFFRADECLSGLEWVLIRAPTLGYRVGNSNVWYFPLVRDDFPPVYVYYTFDDEAIYFLSIRRLDAGNGHKT